MIDAIRNRLRKPPSLDPPKAELVDMYVRDGRPGLALAVLRTMDPEQRARTLASYRRPAHDMPHYFTPRKKGTPLACEICGGRKEDEIHIDRPPRPSPRRDRIGAADPAAADSRLDSDGLRDAD